MREPVVVPQVDEAVAAALASASWITEAIARERELHSLSHPWSLPAGWTEADGARLRREAGKVRRDMVDRLSRERGVARRAAVVCLAQPSLNGYVEELDLALSGSDGWSLVEVAALFTVMRDRDFHYGEEVWLSRVVELVLSFDVEERMVLWDPMKPFIRAVADSGIEAGRRRRLHRLIASVFQARPDALPLSALVPCDEWAMVVRDHLGDAPPETLVRLIDHLSELNGPRPTKTWRVRCLELLRPDDAKELVRIALDAFDRLTEWNTGWAAAQLIVSDSNTDVARGFVWAAALLRADNVVPALTELALRTAGVHRDLREDLKLAGAAINALGDCGDPMAIEALWRLQRSIRHRALHKQIGTALAAAAGREGITPGQLLERNIPDHGLGPDGTLTRTIGDWTAVLTVEDAMTVRFRFRSPEGTTVGTAPAGLKGSDDLKALKAVRKEIRQTLSAERARLEGLLTVDRAWPYEEWVRCYRDHPITGAVARGLIWEAEGRSFLSDEATPGSPVRLWHPARATLEEVTAWRDRVTERRLRQPFKQAFREIYPRTPVEEETRVYSNRFAAHIVDHPRLYALIKERGWQTDWLGPFDGGHAAEARKELAEGAWRVRFRYESAGVGAGRDVTLAATDQVRFDRRQGRAFRQAELAEVPLLVFSEAMRDVDLFVSVTSIAADPEWIDRGDDPHPAYRAYWTETSVGPLPPSAEVRRDALARLLPRTAVADRCTLTDRFLVVRGDLRTYKIHLSSANVLMEPGDVYLCIIADRKPGARLFLPFEEDGRLSLILSKAFLLAGDSKITDESILRQLRTGLRG
ncbi:DUF4132 domain-containing protein [Nonomuraea sp. NPDC050786]|uniref:DUF4132 domain-containing protein n=1 Tax=Nonomuraea sp. NPDC050786 TaxID=3154840 RepID=UPI00340AD37E